MENAALAKLHSANPAAAAKIGDVLQELFGASGTEAPASLTDAEGKLTGAKADVVAKQQAQQRAVKENNDAIREANDAGAAHGEAVKAAQAAINSNAPNKEEKLAAEKTLRAKAEALRTKAESAIQAYTASEAALGAAREALTKAEAGKKNALVKTRLLEAARFGVLADPTHKGLAEGVVLDLIAAHKDHPELASAALDAAPQAEHPEVMARGVTTLGPLAATGFKSPNGDHYPPAAAARMARNALTMGGTLGGDYFARMDAYYKANKHSDPDPFEQPGSSVNLQKRGTDVAQALGKNLVASDGRLNFTSAAAKTTLDTLHFHPNSLQNPLPALAQQIETFRGEIGNGATPMGRAIAAVKAPTAAGGQSVVRKTLGLTGSGAVSEADAKAAVVSAMITPFNQGEVGSCFATAPCRQFCETNRVGLATDLSTIVETGTLGKGSLPPIPVIANIPAGENPLQRGWEYTVATLGARVADSTQKSKLKDAVLGRFEDQRAAGCSNLRDIPACRGKEEAIGTALASAFAFKYDPTVSRTGSADGSSSAGAFVLHHRPAGAKEEDGAWPAITSEEDFQRIMGDVVVGALGTVDPGVATSVRSVVGSAGFKKSMQAAYSKPGQTFSPWDLPGGGQEIDSAGLLSGTTPTRAPLVTPPATGTPAEKTAGLLAGMVSGLSARSAKYVTVAADGIHAMNALPNHPSLNVLKTGDVAANVETHLTEPGRAIATAEIPADKTAFLYDKAMALSAGGATGTGRPAAGMTPKQLKAALVAQGLEADAIDSLLMKELNSPQFVIADSNWGGPVESYQMVIAPDPSTGEPALWKKGAISGEMTREDDTWSAAKWTALS